MRQPIKYNIYPSLLDNYQDYLNSEDTWLKFWGNSETPSLTLEDFEARQLKGLIDKINRVPMAWEDSEKADRGTAFNEIVDCMILGKNSDKMQIEKDFKDVKVEYGTYGCSAEDISYDYEIERRCVGIKAIYNKREFLFPISICREFATYFKGATPQVYCEAVLPTKYGDVKLYGYIDELMPTSIHDIKVTGRYKAWKFKYKWQRVVYPYCINESGSNTTNFEYNILLRTENRGGAFYETKTEYYNYTEADKFRLIEFTENFIDFIEEHKDLITDKKIFNLINN